MTDEIERIRQTYAGYRDGGRSRLWAEDNAGNRAIVEERDGRVRTQLASHLAGDRSRLRLLDVGCGTGAVLESFVALGFDAAAAVGLDLITDRLIEARRDGSHLNLLAADGTAVPLRDESVDVALAYTVFSSIRDERMARGVAHELARVLRPGGVLVWYDLRRNNPRNANIGRVTRSQVRSFFPGWQVSLSATTLVPPLARRLGKRTAQLYPLLARVPVLRTHYVGTICKPTV